MHKFSRSFMETILRAAEDTVDGAAGEDTVSGAVDTVQGAVGADTVVGATGEDTVAGTAAADEPKPTPWFTKRIDELTANWRGTQGELETVKAELALKDAAIEEFKAKNPDAAKTLSDAEIEKQVDRKVAQVIAKRDWDANCNKIFEEGAKLFTKDKFKAAIDEWGKIGGLTVPVIAAVMETETPAELIHALSQDLDEASRLKDLPPTKLAVALERKSQALLAEKAKLKDKKVSKTPAPLDRVDGGANGADATLESAPDIATWMKLREKDIADKRKAGRDLQ